MQKILKNKVKCNNCMQEFEESKIIYDGEEDMEFCPFCGEGGSIVTLKRKEVSHEYDA